MPNLSQIDIEKRVKKIERMVRLLDDSFYIPILNIRFGFDALIGLFPAVGDILTALISLYLVWSASKLEISKGTILTMLWNIALDVLVGSIPLLGDIFDVAFKANRKNYNLLIKTLEKKT
jgi:hypothetical protein